LVERQRSYLQYNANGRVCERLSSIDEQEEGSSEERKLSESIPSY